MTGGVGNFIAGLEGLSFVEHLSDRFEVSPHSIIKRLGVALALLAVCILFLISLQTQLFTSKTTEAGVLNEKEQSVSTLDKLSTEFDDKVGLSALAKAEDVAPQSLVVYVTGAVVAPGLYTLPQDKRVGDAVEAAGGLLPEAATAVVNLAQQISDGMQIHIPRLDEVSDNTPIPPGSTSSTNDSSFTSPQQDGGSGTLININTADSSALQTLDGIGPATAQKIIDYRQAHGKFARKEDLKNVSGIGEKKYAALEAHITV